MTPELMYLVWSAALTFVLVLIAVSSAILEVGLPTLAGNREGLPNMTGWAGRARRAHFNMLESLILFAVLVLVAQAAGVHNAATLLGAQLFFWGRVAHAVARAEGPERIAMEWWRHHEPKPTRDYYRVEDSEGRRFWLYRDGLYGRETDRPRWYVHGLFA